MDALWKGKTSNINKKSAERKATIAKNDKNIVDLTSNNVLQKDLPKPHDSCRKVGKKMPPLESTSSSDEDATMTNNSKRPFNCQLLSRNSSSVDIRRKNQQHTTSQPKSKQNSAIIHNSHNKPPQKSTSNQTDSDLSVDEYENEKRKARNRRLLHMQQKRRKASNDKNSSIQSTSKVLSSPEPPKRANRTSSNNFSSESDNVEAPSLQKSAKNHRRHVYNTKNPTLKPQSKSEGDTNSQSSADTEKEPEEKFPSDYHPDSMAEEESSSVSSSPSPIARRRDTLLRTTYGDKSETINMGGEPDTINMDGEQGGESGDFINSSSSFFADASNHLNSSMPQDGSLPQTIYDGHSHNESLLSSSVSDNSSLLQKTVAGDNIQKDDNIQKGLDSKFFA